MGLEQNRLAMLLAVLHRHAGIATWEQDVFVNAVGKIADPTLKAALMEAHVERWGIFVGVWPVTLLVLSEVLARRNAGS